MARAFMTRASMTRAAAIGLALSIIIIVEMVHVRVATSAPHLSFIVVCLGFRRWDIGLIFIFIFLVLRMWLWSRRYPAFPIEVGDWNGPDSKAITLLDLPIS